MQPVVLTAEMIEAFAGLFLSPRYDQPQPTPPFHRECWQRYCSSHPAAATAAPRNHAKSTGLTHDFILANVCFRVEDYVILIGASEEMAIEHLGDIANELRENEDLIREFKIKGFVQDQKTDIIVECEDGWQFRIVARGAEQKIRGRKWRGRRPGLIVGDDLEDDEQVENKERRKKFRRWFFRACKQALRDGGRIRVHGTILHVDSLLNHLMKNRGWWSKLYKAHRSFTDFSEILWPEKFPESRLRKIRDQEFVAEGDGPGYSQEYLNDPTDTDDNYIRKEDMLPMTFFKEGNEVDYRSFYMMKGCGVDFAVSKEDTANKTSFVVGGKCIDQTTCIIDRQTGRWDSKKIIDMFFVIQARHNVECFYPEDGVIWKTIEPMLRDEMKKPERDGITIMWEPRAAVKDKAVRGRMFQRRSRAGLMRFDKEADWYPEYESVILLFRADAEALDDDDFDATSHLVNGLEERWIDEEDAKTEEEREFEEMSLAAQAGASIGDPYQGGRSKTTGY